VKRTFGGKRVRDKRRLLAEWRIKNIRIRRKEQCQGFLQDPGGFVVSICH
jgi:hypothetical protein